MIIFHKFLWAGYCCLLLGILLSCQDNRDQRDSTSNRQPNFLFAISDDQSYPHASAYGDPAVRTPVFDEIARQGVLFQNVFCAAPQCSPNRAAILTGKNIWQLEEAGTHASYFPSKFSVFTDVLEKGGYELGYTGKAWGPGNWKDSGWTRNPVGPGYNEVRFDSTPTNGIHNIDYAGNFSVFLDNRPKGKPFFFWYGGFEPHRDYEEGSAASGGRNIEEVAVPPFLPDVPEIRNDLLDYALEIEWFDQQLGKMIDMLKEAGEYDNTVIIITGDNGMPFPYAKANLQEFGIHVPLAIKGPSIGSGQVSEHLISHIDLAPTILDIAGVSKMENITGLSFLSLMMNSKDGVDTQPRSWVLAGRERHTHARPDNLGYPSRAIRTDEFLYIQNSKPELWPAGDPEINSSEKDEKGVERIVNLPAYFDIDASPAKDYLLNHKAEFPAEFQLAFGKRPAEELFDIKSDPGCLQNLAYLPAYSEKKIELQKNLEMSLISEGDPRMGEEGDIFDSYPRISPMRDFPGFKEQGKYNPAFGDERNVQ